MTFPTDSNSELTRQLIRIADALERMANGGEPTAPEMRRPIEEYKTFDWAAIDASVVNSDIDGATMVEYAGTLWTRRSPVNKYEPAIWFSRANGKDAVGAVKYLKLITFQTIHDADPLPKKAAELASRPAFIAPPPPKKELPSTIALREQFVKLGTNKTFNLTTEAAGWLFDNLNGNVEIGQLLLPVMAEAKANGMTGLDVTKLLRAGKFDPQDCLAMVREQGDERQRQQLIDELGIGKIV